MTISVEKENLSPKKRGRPKGSHKISPDVAKSRKQIMTANWIKTRHWKRKQGAISALGGQCEHCGKIYPGHEFYLYDFHHIDPSEKATKSLNIVSDELFWAEIRKCILLCCECHRRLHWGNSMELTELPE